MATLAFWLLFVTFVSAFAAQVARYAPHIEFDV